MDATPLAIVSILINKQHCFEPWFNFVKNCELPSKANLYIVDASADPKFAEQLDDHFLQLGPRFNSILRVRGKDFFKPKDNRNPRDKGLAREKHQNVCDNFNIGLSLLRSEKLLMTIDDDVIPPLDAISHLTKKFKQIPNCAGISGIYLNHPDYGCAPDQFVFSVEKQYWFTVTKKTLPSSSEVFEAGFFGTGCALWDVELVKKNLPLEVYLEESGWWIGPDGYLCKKIRDSGAQIFIDPTIKCDHL